RWVQEASQVVFRIRGPRERPEEAVQVCRRQRRVSLSLDGEAPGSRVARMVARPWHGLGSEGKSGWSHKDRAKQAAGRESTLHGSRALRRQAASPRRTEAAA